MTPATNSRASVLQGAMGQAEKYPRSLVFETENGTRVTTARMIKIAAKAIRIVLRVKRPVYQAGYGVGI